MKRWIFVFIAVFLISCTENEATQSTSENEAGSSLITEETGTDNWKHNSFKELYDFYRIYDSSFTPDSLVLVQ
jgi:hypothetical protein